ncbi:MAG: hypothetical protein ACRDIE_16495, partial [Chloroflexota bacterium]
VVYLDQGSALQGFTIRNSGNAFWDAAVWLEGPATVNRNRVEHDAMGIVRYCFTTPCFDISSISGNLVANITNTGILVHGAGAMVQDNTVAGTGLQALTFEAPGAVGSASRNILSDGVTGLTEAPGVSADTNLLWQMQLAYGSGATPSPSDIQADPLFTNPAGDDYSLHAGSPARAAGGDLGAYPFTPFGIAPANLTAAQTSQGLQLSWPSTGAAGYYVYSNAPSGGYFGQPIDNGSATSALIPLPPAGSYNVAVSSYDAQHRESEITTAVANVAGVILAPKVAAIGQTVAVTVTGYAANEPVTLTIAGGSCPGGTSHPLLAGSTNSTGLLATSFVLPSLCTIVTRPDSSANAGTSVSIAATGAGSGLTTAATLAIPGTSVSAYAEGASVDLSGAGFTAGEQVSFVFKPTQSQTSLPAAVFPADSTGRVTGFTALPHSLIHGTYT